MRIADVMTRGVKCVTADATLDQAAKLMEQEDVGFLPVVSDGRPIGVVTDRDIVVRATSSGASPTGTRVGDVMSDDVVSCLEDEPITSAAEMMEQCQIRRLLVVDRNSRLRGVVSLGDLALRHDDPLLAEDVLEEVSSPGHGFAGRRVRDRKPVRRSKTQHSFTGLPIGLMLGAIATGALVMYMMDPERGARRRAVLRDKMIHASKVARRRIGKSARYAAGKTYGVKAKLVSRFRSSDVNDQQLCERVRSALGRVVSHPHAIEVNAQDGIVSLVGPILAHEVDDLLSTARSVRGVRDLQCRLSVHKHAGNHPQLQGGRRHSRNRRNNSSGISVQKDIHINAPIEDVFHHFSQYENFPHFMSCVREVRDVGNGRSHWVVAGPAGFEVTWDAEVTQFEPNSIISWRSLPGSKVSNEGIIHFESNGHGGTHVDIKLTYQPPAGALGHAIAKLFGADPKSELDADLLRLKTMIETGHAPHDAAQPQITTQPQITKRSRETTQSRLGHTRGELSPYSPVAQPPT